MRSLPVLLAAVSALTLGGCGRLVPQASKVAVQPQKQGDSGVPNAGQAQPREEPAIPPAEPNRRAPPKPIEPEKPEEPLTPLAKAELDKFQGTWILTDYDNGEPQRPQVQGRLVVKGSDYTFEFQNSVTKGKIRLDPSHSPGHIDAIITDRTTGLPSVLPGIYEMDDQQHRSIFAQAGRPRPTSFQVPPMSGLQLFVFRRANEEEAHPRPKPANPK